MYRFRTVLATVLWLGAAAAATALAVAALLRALAVDLDAAGVSAVLDAADRLSLGALPRVAGDTAAQTGTATAAVVVWGLAALLWLVVGWVLDRLVRPVTPGPR